MSGIWQVVHVAEQLHEVAPQSRHDIRRIPASQAPHHPYGQSPHHPRLIIQRHKQGPQTAHTHRHTHHAQLQLWLTASVWLWRRTVSCSELKIAARKVLSFPPPPPSTLSPYAAEDRRWLRCFMQQLCLKSITAVVTPRQTCNTAMA